MHNQTDRGYGIAGALLAGAIIGGGAALLMAPQTGPQLRRQLRSYADNAKQGLTKTWSSAVEQGIDYAERGQRALRDADRAMGTAIDRGREYLDEGKRVADQTSEVWSGLSQFSLPTVGAVLASVVIGAGLAFLMASPAASPLREQVREYADKAMDQFSMNRG